MVTFNEHIKPMFSPYAGAMRQVQVSSADGVEQAEIDDYDFVKRFHGRILARIKGMNSFGQKVPVMPPPDSGYLSPEQIQLFEQWIADGMLEGGTVA